jgi:hypothetical protein
VKSKLIFFFAQGKSCSRCKLTAGNKGDISEEKQTCLFEANKKALSVCERTCCFQASKETVANCKTLHIAKSITIKARRTSTRKKNRKWSSVISPSI